jgi:hypothetical protein
MSLKGPIEPPDGLYCCGLQHADGGVDGARVRVDAAALETILPLAPGASATLPLRLRYASPRDSGAGGLTREVETPYCGPQGHMILSVELVGSHGRWKRPCLQTAHMTI